METNPYWNQKTPAQARSLGGGAGQRQLPWRAPPGQHHADPTPIWGCTPTHIWGLVYLQLMGWGHNIC